MFDLIASAVIALAGLYLVALGLAAWLAPAIATGFLLGFASSAAMHYLEMCLRLLVGAALVVRGHAMMFGEWIFAFGWLLVATTAALVAIPWRWHHRFAQHALPRILRHLKPFGAVALALGAALILALARGPN